MIRTGAPSLRHGLRILLGAALLTGVVAFTPRSMRYIGLARSVPAKDSHVMTAPKEIRLTFTESVDVSKSSVELASADGKAVALDTLRAVADAPRDAVARVTGTLTSGNYTVKWRAVAADGASGSGSFSFMFMPMTHGAPAPAR